jgi:hypothetical protein
MGVLPEVFRKLLVELSFDGLGIWCQLVEQLFQFMKKVKMIEVVYYSTVKEARTYRDLRPL